MFAALAKMYFYRAACIVVWYYRYNYTHILTLVQNIARNCSLKCLNTINICQGWIILSQCIRGYYVIYCYTNKLKN